MGGTRMHDCMFFGRSKHQHMEKRLQTTGAIGLSVNSGRRDKVTKTIDPVLGERTACMYKV